LAHEQILLSDDTIDSVLWHWEVGWAKDLSAPLCIAFKSKERFTDVWKSMKQMENTEHLMPQHTEYRHGSFYSRDTFLKIMKINIKFPFKTVYFLGAKRLDNLILYSV